MRGSCVGMRLIVPHVTSLQDWVTQHDLSIGRLPTHRPILRHWSESITLHEADAQVAAAIPRLNGSESIISSAKDSLWRLCRRKRTLATDGEIDFGAYTREQLDNAVGRMDRQRYPINYRNLVAEYQRRQVVERQV